jgi:hypothetical protein
MQRQRARSGDRRAHVGADIREIVVVQNWFEELKRVVPTK